MKILFIENHSIFAKQVSAQFLSEHQVTVVPSLSAARTDFQSQSYDLVLVDYDLDDGKGDEFVKSLRGTGCSVRIIGVSAREDGNKALMKAGANAICSKMEFDRIREIL